MKFFSLTFIKELFTKDWQVKLIALTVTLILWYFANKT